MKKLKEFYNKIYATLKRWHISFVGGQLKKRQTLTNIIRKMILKTLKKVENKFLKYFYIEIRFSTMDNLNNYRLPIIGHLVNYDEAILVQRTIINGLIDNNFNITSIPNQPNEILDLEKTKNEIINSQQINGFNTIKLILERKKLENGIYSRYVDSDLDKLMFNINIIGNERTPFIEIKDLFIIYLDKKILE